MEDKLVGIFICMLLVGTVLPVSGTVIVERTSISTSFGNTLYVGGSGPGNYTSIQEAIDDASDGDTVFVYDDSSPYYENLIVDKSISLIGEDKLTTVIDGNEKEENGTDVISIKKDGVTITGFTIQNSSIDGREQDWKNYYCGIEIRSHNNIINDNIITDNYYGIQMGGIQKIYSNSNLIEDNIIKNNEAAGIFLTFAFDNTISGNIISSNRLQGVFLTYDSGNNLVVFNNISFNERVGVAVGNANNNTIQRNTIIENEYGISIRYASKTKVLENNVFNNEKDTIFYLDTINWLINGWFDNTWDGNYWGQPSLLPKLIPGKCYLIIPSVLLMNLFGDIFGITQPLSFPVFKFDRHPVQEPYDI